MADAAAKRELAPEDVVAQTEKSVALIETPVGSGTGFMVAPGILATNVHVVELATIERIKVYFPAAGAAGNTPAAVERIVHFDPKRDLALLSVNTQQRPLPVAKAFVLKRGQRVTVIGNPGIGRGAFKLENAVALDAAIKTNIAELWKVHEALRLVACDETGDDPQPARFRDVLQQSRSQANGRADGHDAEKAAHRAAVDQQADGVKNQAPNQPAKRTSGEAYAQAFPILHRDARTQPEEYAEDAQARARAAIWAPRGAVRSPPPIAW